VEAGQGVAEFLRGEVADHAMEVAQHDARLVGVLRVTHFLVGLRAGDLGDRAPEVAVGVRHPVFARLGLDDLGKLPDTVRAFRLDLELGVAVVGEHAHVLHDHLGLREDGLTDALHDEALFREGRPEDREVRVVDVAGAVGLDGHEPSLDVELAGDQGGSHGAQATFALIFAAGEGISPVAKA